MNQTARGSSELTSLHNDVSDGTALLAPADAGSISPAPADAGSILPAPAEAGSIKLKLHNKRKPGQYTPIDAPASKVRKLKGKLQETSGQGAYTDIPATKVRKLKRKNDETRAPKNSLTKSKKSREKQRSQQDANDDSAPGPSEPGTTHICIRKTAPIHEDAGARCKRQKTTAHQTYLISPIRTEPGSPVEQPLMTFESENWIKDSPTIATVDWKAVKNNGIRQNDPGACKNQNHGNMPGNKNDKANLVGLMVSGIFVSSEMYSLMMELQEGWIQHWLMEKSNNPLTADLDIFTYSKGSTVEALPLSEEEQTFFLQPNITHVIATNKRSANSDQSGEVVFSDNAPEAFVQHLIATGLIIPKVAETKVNECGEGSENVK
ncbi:hypothetical protein PtB15_17B116 [Puccinia triticina]|nr:hypothetical protein PtB15_17B116 [Puccinia triticina]